MDIVKGVKGFDKEMKCRGFQFESGKEYTHTGPVEACSSGFHYCENPMDVWGYYPPNESKYAEVEGSGALSKHDGDSKVACSTLKIGAEVSLSAMIQGAVKFVFEKTKVSKDTIACTGYKAHAASTSEGASAVSTGYKANAVSTGNFAHAVSTGNYSHAASTGEGASAVSTGYKAHAASTGKNSIAASLGAEGVARAALGNWIVLSELDLDYNLKSVKTAKVDGKKIKAGVWYTLKNGKFVKADVE